MKLPARHNSLSRYETAESALSGFTIVISSVIEHLSTSELTESQDACTFHAHSEFTNHKWKYSSAAAESWRTVRRGLCAHCLFGKRLGTRLTPNSNFCTHFFAPRLLAISIDAHCFSHASTVQLLLGWRCLILLLRSTLVPFLGKFLDATLESRRFFRATPLKLPSLD